MRPTRRNFVALGKTSASACRASSIRGMVVPMPCPTLPAIEPDASNTIMASSLHGEGCGSSARTASTSHAAVTASEIAARQTERKSRTMLCAPWGCPTDAQSTPALSQPCLGDHRAVEGLLQRLYKLILAVGLDIEAAILFGHAHQVHDAVPPCPRVALVSKGDDVNGKLVASGMELL